MARYGGNVDAVLDGSWESLWSVLIWRRCVAERAENGISSWREAEVLKLGVSLSFHKLAKDVV